MSSAAYQMMSVAIGWQIYAITHSAFSLGLVGLAQFLPMFILTLVVGHVADRYDRRTIAFICQGIQGVAALTLCVATWRGVTGVGLIYVLAAIGGSARAFESPSMAALPPTLIPRSQSRIRPDRKLLTIDCNPNPIPTERAPATIARFWKFSPNCALPRISAVTNPR